jgi:1-aminocyclopropane-1-carboxylate deaminase
VPGSIPDFRNIILDTWDHRVFRETEVEVDVLRLDKIHSDISGNKWFKLKYHVEKAKRLNKNTLISFGGAYSNHLLALAATANIYGFHSFGFIRGEEPPRLSPTLISAKEYGMNLFFLPRAEFDLKKKANSLNGLTGGKTGAVADFYPDSLIIPEGGAGIDGIRGSEEILSLIPSDQYTHIFSAVGTGTTLAGLINSSVKEQKIIGVSVLKGTRNLNPLDLNWVKDGSRLPDIQMIHGYHFGGYAKFNDLLIGFMNTVYAESGIPTDFVYTGKLFFAVISLAEMRLFPPGSRILVIHTGGLQGNRSLTPGLLGF